MAETTYERNYADDAIRNQWDRDDEDVIDAPPRTFECRRTRTEEESREIDEALSHATSVRFERMGWPSYFERYEISLADRPQMCYRASCLESPLDYDVPATYVNSLLKSFQDVKMGGWTGDYGTVGTDEPGWSLSITMEDGPKQISFAGGRKHPFNLWRIVAVLEDIRSDAVCNLPKDLQEEIENMMF